MFAFKLLLIMFYYLILHPIICLHFVNFRGVLSLHSISLPLIMGQKFRIPQLENSVGVCKAKVLRAKHFS